eukprot:166733_1
MADSEVINKTLTNFMREEVKKHIEERNYKKQQEQEEYVQDEPAETINDYNGQSSEQAINFDGASQDNVDGDDDGGLPARLPTEIMNLSPDEEVPEQYQNPTDDVEYEQEVINQNENMEISQQETYYYTNNEGQQMGPITMDDVANKYKNNEISDDTEIWSNYDNDKKLLSQNEKIYSKLPKPPKRKQNSNDKIETTKP